MAVNQINNYYFGTNQPLADTAEAIFKGILKDHELSMVQRCDILHVQVPAETYFNMCVCERERETERERQRNQITYLSSICMLSFSFLILSISLLRFCEFIMVRNPNNYFNFLIKKKKKKKIYKSMKCQTLISRSFKLIF
jgi:hypothetical protein